jgi:hemerythrin-like domain-containing protein
MLRDPSLIPLSHQHHNGLALGVLTRRALRADPSAENVVRQAGRIVARYELELVNHFEIEEQVLFPACGPLPIIAELVADHRALEALVGQLRESPTLERIDMFLDLLARHIRREENELFEQIQRDVPREVLDDAGREIDRRAVRACLLP